MSPGDYDYTFCDLVSSAPFEVYDVRFICGRYQKQSPERPEIAQLVTKEYGTINSGSKTSIAGARVVKTALLKTKRPVRCQIVLVGNTNFGRPICQVKVVL